jgi:hypothetical protein
MCNRWKWTAFFKLYIIRVFLLTNI